MTRLAIAAWNVRTLLDNANSARSDRRTALVASELERYNIDIAALSETRFAAEGQLTEKGAGYTYFWSGRKLEERRESGVGFPIKSNSVKNIESLPKGVNDRLMVMHLPLSDKKHATLVGAYASTVTNPDEVKDKFYEELDSLISTVHRADKFLGDFSARIGSNYEAWNGTMGSRHGVGKSNSNGLLLQICSSHDLVITNTLFQLATRKKNTWLHPRSKHWHVLDYVIARRTDQGDHV